MTEKTIENWNNGLKMQSLGESSIIEMAKIKQIQTMNTISKLNINDLARYVDETDFVNNILGFGYTISKINLLNLFRRVLYCLTPKVTPEEICKYIGGKNSENLIMVYPYKINVKEVPCDCEEIDK
jgi:hypothetical protein